MADQWNDATPPVNPGPVPLPLTGSGSVTAGAPQLANPVSPSVGQSGAAGVTAPPAALPGSTQAAPPPSPVPAADLPALDVGSLSLRSSVEIQGNILAGFHKDHQVFVFFGFPAQIPSLPPNQDRARQWLNELIPRLATTKEVADFNRRFSAARQANGGTILRT